MASIDDRIVNMQFNNAQFQKGIAETNTSLQDLEQNLKLTGATSGIDEVQVAANKFSLANMEAALTNISSKFGVFGAVGFTIIQNLTNSALDAGKNIASALIEPIVAGGAKRALALQQAKFQFQGLGLDIQATMDAALNAVRGTAFGLDDAATAAASFGATGITAANGLETVLRSVAGVAAQTGSSYSQVANIFQTVAGNGRLMGDQLNQLASYGVNVAAIMAKTLGVSEAELRDMVSKGKISFQQFSDAMNQAFGANAAKANETYTGALSNMRAALARIGAEVASPYFLGMRDVFNTLGPTFDNIHTAIQPLLDDISQLISLGSANTVSGIQNIFGSGLLTAIGNVVTLIQKLAHILDTSFHQIFPDDTTNQLSAIGRFLQQITEALIPTSQQASELRRTFAGVFAIFSVLGQIVSSIVKVFFDLLGVISPAGGSFLEITARIGDLLVHFDSFLKKGQYIQNFFKIIGGLLSGPIAVLQTFFGVIADGIKNFSLFKDAETSMRNFSDDVSERFSALIKLGEFFGAVWQGVKNVATAVWGFLQPIFETIGSWIATGVNAIRTELEKLKFDDVMQVLNTGIFAAGTGGFLFLLRGFFGNIGGALRGNGVAFVNQFNLLFGGLRTNLKALEQSTNAKTLKDIAIAVALLAASAVALSLVDAASLGLAMGAIVTSMGSLLASMAVLNKVGGTKGIFQALALSQVLIGLSTAILILSTAIAILGALPLPNLIQGTAALVVVLAALTGSLAIMGKIGPSVISSALAISILAPAILLLSAAVAILGALPLANLIQGMIGFVVMIGALVGALALLAQIGPMALVGAISIALIAPAILLLTGAVAAMAALPLVNLIQGVGALVVMLAALAGAVLLLSLAGPMALLGAVAIAAVALSLVPMIGAIALLSAIPVDNLIAGMVAFGVALAVLVGAVLLLGFTGPVALIGAAAIVAIALAMAVLAPALKLLSTISWDEIGRLLTVLSAGLGILVVMGILLIPASVGFLLLGAAILLIGTGVYLAAAGVGLLALGIGALVAIGAGAFALLGQAITVFIQQLPAIGAGIGEALVAMAVVIGQNAPQLIQAFVQLLLAMLDAIDQVVPRLIEVATDIIVALVEALIILIPLLVDAGLQIIGGILEGIANNIEKITTQAINIITNFINALANNIGKIIDAGANLVVKFIKGLADGITNNSAAFTREGTRLFKAIVDAVANAIEAGGSALRYAGQRIGNALLQGAKNALGIRSPSKKFSDEVMPAVFDGIDRGNDKNLSRAADAGAAIGNAVGDTAMTTMQQSLSQLSDALDLSDIDTSPTIRPVLDLSDLENKSSQVSGMLQSPTLSLGTSNDFAQSASLQEQARNAQIVLDASKQDDTSKGYVTFIQNNNSPKALSTVELYRQTRNQLSTLKGELGVVDQSGSS